MTDLGTLVPGGFSNALAINANGYIVGASGPFDACCPAHGQSHGFVWDPNTGTMSDLGVSTRDYAGGIWSVASAINAAGTIGGYGRNNYWSYNESAYSANVTSLAFLTHDPEFETTGLNALKVVVGSTPWYFAYIGGTQHAYTFDLSTETLTDLGTLPGDVGAGANGINDLGVVVGFSTASNGCSRAVTWNTAPSVINTVPVPAGGGCSAGYGISASGVVVGGYATPTGEHAFAFDPSVGTPVDLGTLGGAESRAYGVNGQGHVVGSSNTATGARHAFVYDLGAKLMTDLGVLPTNTTSEARSINDADKVVGVSDGGAAGQHAILWTVTFAEVSQSISFTSTPPSPALTGGTYAVAATGGASRNAVTFSSLTASVCTVSGSTVSLNAVGSCTVAADQAAGSGYSAAAQQTQIFSIGSPILGNIGLLPKTATLVAGWANRLTVTRTGLLDVPLPITITTTNGVFIGEPATSNSIAPGQTGTLLMSVGADSKAIIMVGVNGPSQETVIVGATNYTPDTATITFVKGTILLSGWPTSLAVGDSVPLQISAADQFGNLNGNLAFTTSFALEGTGLVFRQGQATLTSINIPLRTSAVFYVKATAGGSLTATISSRDYVTYTASVNVTAAAQSISFTSTPPSPALIGGTYTVAATGGASGSAVSFSSLTASVCTVNGTTASFIGVGTCRIAANQAGGNGYQAAPQAEQAFVVTGTVQVITFISNLPSPGVVGGTYTLSATGGGSGNPVIFSSATSGTCAVAGNQVSALAAGTCVVAANQAGSLGYFAAPEVTRTFSIVAVPTSKDSCKDDGWKSVARANGSTFKNQGDCVQYFNAKK